MGKARCLFGWCVLALTGLAAVSGVGMAGPPPTIVIQGKLVGPGTQSISGLRDYRIRFFDMEVAGSQLGGDLTGSVDISDSGRFTIEIVPPGAALAAVETWYELAVDSDVQANGIDNGDVFPDRIQLHSVPFALWASDSDALGGIPAADYATDAELAAHTISLDEAYDDGGSGAGRTITADAGPVAIGGNGGLESIGQIKLVQALGGNLFASLGQNGAGGGVLRTRDELDNQTSILGSSAAGGGGFLHLAFDGTDALIGVLLDGWDGDSGRIALSSSNGRGGSAQTVLLDAGESGVGSVLRMTDGTNETIEIDANGAGGGAGITMRNDTGTETVRIDGDDGNDGLVVLYQETGVAAITLDASELGTDGGQITVRRADGTGTIFIDGDFNGDGRITTQELQITGGSDLSEQFDIQSPTGKVEPGMVVSIDPKRPGKLIVSGRAYDRTVAGIVSGAGGLETGMMMGQAGSEADGEHPVALTGRVYCWCEASNGPIEPGDLLTTSNMPGHAMKVTDHVKAQGAILGKAMTSLPQGKGLVLVLVSLQ